MIVTNLGMNGVGLDADRTRDELASTLGEIERRLTPAHIRRRLIRSVKRRPGPFIAAGIGVMAGVSAIILLVTKKAGHRG